MSGEAHVPSAFEAYLDRRLAGDAEAIDDFLETIPASERSELRERLAALSSAGLLEPTREVASVATIPSLPDFELLECLGRGGHGEVWRARQKSLDRQVALKFLHPWMQARRTSQERFEQEARALAGLTHPNIVTLHEYGVAEGRPYLVMDLVEGRSLADIRPAGGLPPNAQEIRSLVAHAQQLARALDDLHQQGVLHRDVKPTNVRLDARGEPVLLDFGLVFLERDVELTRSREFVGTAVYAAPEQLRGEARDRRVDVYGLTATLFRMLTGKVPVEGTTVAEIVDRMARHGARPARALNRAIDRRLEAVLRMGLAADPRERYASCADLAADLEGWAIGGVVHAARARALIAGYRWVRRKPVHTTAFVSIVVSMAMGASLLRRWSIDRAAELQVAIDAGLSRHQALSRIGDVAAADQELSRVEELRPDHPEVAFRRVLDVLKGRGNFDPSRMLDQRNLAALADAMRRAEPILGGEPCYEALHQLQELYRSNRRPTAIDAEDLRHTTPRSAAEYGRLYDALVLFGVERRSLLFEGLKLDPRALDLHESLARTAAHLGELSALEGAVACRTIAPERADYQMLVPRLRFKEMLMLRAEARRQLMDLGADETAVAAGLAGFDRAIAEAVSEVDRLCSSTVDNATALIDASLVYSEMPQPRKSSAEALLRRVAEIGSYPVVSVNLGILLYDKIQVLEGEERDQVMREYLEIAAEHEGYKQSKIGYWQTRAWVAEQLDDENPATGRELLERGLAIDPSTGQPRCNPVDLPDLHLSAARHCVLIARSSEANRDEFHRDAEAHLRQVDCTVVPRLRFGVEDVLEVLGELGDVELADETWGKLPASATEPKKAEYDQLRAQLVQRGVDRDQ